MPSQPNYLGIDQPWGSRGYGERCVVEFLLDGEFKMSLDGEENLAVYKITREEW